MRLIVRRALTGLTLAFALPLAAIAQGKLTTPKQFFGHEIGEDYWLPNYTQFAKYWETLAKESDRMVLDTIGLTAEGRPQLMAIVSSPDNIKNREKYRQIAERLSHAEGLTEEQARSLAKNGKAVVWIDGGLHATEVLGSNQLIETSWQFVSQNDEETLRILNDVFIVFVAANPDGWELVANWYMRESDPKKRNMQIPRLYQKYIGHDNNRDFYAVNQPETYNMNRAMYQMWYPQIMYNHHQTGPAGTVMFAPPFRDPMNYNLHSQIMTGLDQVGSAMHARFVAENKPGVTMRSGMLYSTWWNGGLRTDAYFHNIIGILTETIGNPTPMRIPLVPDKLLRTADLPLPIQPQEWHFRQSIEYSVTANRAILDFAQRFRETLLYRNWEMGAEEIAAGSSNHWTLWPKRLDAMKKAIADAAPARTAGDASGGRFGGFQNAAAADPKFLQMLSAPDLRDPRGYIIPSNQADFPTALKFVDKLQKNAIVVQRANAAFTVAGKSYPAGSIVVKTAQAYRPFVVDMFEPQDHPNDFRFPGAPPTPPYDNAGYTLALQMGVQFDRVLDGFDCPCDKIDPSKLVTAPAGTVAKAGSWKLSPVQNDAFAAVARLQKGGIDVYRGLDGNFYVASNGKSRPIVEQAAKDLGVTFAEGKRPASAQKLTAPRIALYDRYGGQMPSGHTRWLLEQFGVPYTDIYPQELDAGNLRAKYDVIVFPDGSIPAIGGRGGRGGGGGPDTTTLPPELRKTVGAVTVDKTIPQLRDFLQAGGRVVTIGSSTSLAQHLGLPIESYLTEGGRALPQEKFYVPGSILKATFDTSAMVSKGMAAQADVFFDNSPVFKLGPDAASKGIKRIAWYEKSPLVSGWAWGENYLEGGTAIAEASVGQGTLYLFGPEIMFRAQPHGTFRLFFNTLYTVKPPIQ